MLRRDKAPAITVDVHERGSRIAERLEALGLAVVVRHLVIGDYATGDCLIERKTVLDLHLTLRERRLWRQLSNLRASGQQAYLLVEGRSVDAGPIPKNAIRGALLAAMEHRIRVVRSDDEADSALWLTRIAWRGAQGRPTMHDEQHWKPRVPSPESVLASVAGVGIRSARHLLDHFGTIRDLALANPEELASVRGIGPKRAARLHETLTRSRNRERDDPST